MIAYALILADLYPLLNASSSSDLIWWTEAELIRAMEDAVRGLGIAGAFAERNEVNVIGTDPVVGLPAQTLSVVHVSLDGQSLEPASLAEMEALSATWEEDEGEVSRFLVMTEGTIRLWQIPASGGTLAIIRHAYPFVESFGTHRAPAVFGTYLKYAALATARAKDSDGAAPDIATAARDRAAVIARQVTHLWGGAQ